MNYVFAREWVERRDALQHFVVSGVLTSQRHRAKLTTMKRKKAQVEKASVGTVLAARARAEGNKWTDAEREKLGEQFMKLFKTVDQR